MFNGPTEVDEHYLEEIVKSLRALEGKKSSIDGLKIVQLREEQAERAFQTMQRVGYTSSLTTSGI